MTNITGQPRWIILVRWIARIWSLLLLVILLLELIVPDPNLVRPIPIEDWVMVLTFPGMAVVGLLIAWRWEMLGAIINLVCYLLLLIEFRLLFSEWFPAGRALGLFALFATPGLLFLICSRATRTAKGGSK